MESNEAILHSVRKLLTDSVKSNQLITPAGEWLLDNFYLLEEHIRSAKIHFPKDTVKTFHGWPEFQRKEAHGFTTSHYRK
ncbi:MAG: hypothetical protein IPJ20_23415 [Flammeovirgaceae bacterium]|nr:hypothetical protein [Flammeovirgaceae bacterium]